MEVKYEIFSSLLSGREKMCRKAAEFASGIDPERLINISMTDSDVVVVWYRVWT